MKFRLLYLLLILSIVKQSNAVELLIISHSGSSIESISESDLVALFLKRKTLVQGIELEVIQHRTNSDERVDFARKYLGMSMEEESLYWRQQLVQQGIRPPKSKKNSKIIQKYLFRHPNTISYIFETTELTEDLKVIQVKH